MVHRDKIKYDCHSCRRSFLYTEIQEGERDYGNIRIKTRVCPFCGSESWSSYEERKKLDRFLLLNL